MADSSSLVLDTDWSRGIVRDAPRGSIPEGGLRDARDFLFHKPGIAVKRGGTAYAGPALGSANYAAGVAYVPFSSGSQRLGIGNDAHLYKVTSGATTDMGAAYVTVDTPKFRVGATKSLLVVTASDGTSAPKAYNGLAVAALGGSPPAGKYAAVYKTHLVLAGTAGNPDRLFFSPVPDIEAAWDVTNSWIDTDFPVTGLAALQNAIIIFSSGKTQRLTGTTPPPGTDMDRQPIGDVGCTDARSIVIYEGRVIFANQTGVYWTDGVTYRSLTQDAGIETLWQSYFTSDLPPTHIACGLLGSFLIVCVRDAAEANVATLMCNLPRNAWWPLQNINAMMFASSVGTFPECYYADKNAARVTQLSGLLNPAAGNKADANGTAVEPMLETRLLAGGPTLKHYGFGHLSVDMRDAASDNPTLAVAFAPGLEATTYTAAPESPLAETTDNKRYRFTVGKVSQGGTLKFTQTGASSKTEIYAVEVQTRGLPFLAGGQ